MKIDYNQFTDEELFDFLREDNQQALVSLYNRYWKKLTVVAVNLTGCLEEAEECVQNVFISLWKRRNELDLTHSLYTYLTVSIKYQSLTQIAANQKRQAHLKQENSYKQGHLITPDIVLITKELAQLIENSINRLPEQCQIVFRKNKEQGLTVKQIAEELNLSPNTVKMHLKIANRKLKDDLLIVLPFVVAFLNK